MVTLHHHLPERLHLSCVLTLASFAACRYITTFQSGFDAGLGSVQLLFMQSDGGLASVGDFSGHKAVLSGPAGA